MRSRWLMSLLVVALATVVGVEMSAQQQGERGGGGGGRGGGRGFNLPPLLMQTDAFPDGGIVPQKYAGRGGVQPGFKFSGAPEGTMSYAIIFHDIDVALQGNTGDVLHWIAWNIPASAGGIPEGKLPDGAVQGANITGQNVYFGPGAPAGPRYHHYVFELYALNSNLDLPATAGRDELLKAMAGKITAKAAYVGRYRGEAPAAK
ncbi:MAG TPA: YbhB/YbcL family Raf kinase inhibitor-like protein [Vicinamibacterales bacterium]|nr:YbhB/YbcL family Raf kinase inhibitor-like protein [Vicinamibacterales bacterium]